MSAVERVVAGARDKQYLPIGDVIARYRVSVMSIERWLRDPRMAFPQPVYFGRRRFWLLNDIENWERERVARRSA